MHKQSTNEKVQNKNLNYIFSFKRQADMFLFKYSLLGQQVFIFFFFTFPKNWVGRVMGNETFYWDCLNNKKIYITLTWASVGLPKRQTRTTRMKTNFMIS